MRLLIAEDERDLAEALSVFFEKNQFTVDTVCNGFDAYEYAVTGDYDAIVLDVMMPKLNGVEVLERLRAEGVPFPEAMARFRAWCGEDCVFLTWGFDDITVLRENLAVFGLADGWTARWYNAQLILNAQTDGCLLYTSQSPRD